MITEYTNTTPVEHAVAAMLEANQALMDLYGDNYGPVPEFDPSASRYLVYDVTDITPTPVKKQISRVDQHRIRFHCINTRSRDDASEDGLKLRRAVENKTGIYAGLIFSQIKYETYNGTFDDGLNAFRAIHDFTIKVQNT